MTTEAPPSNRADRLNHRAAGALLAVAVQALFVAALLLWAVPPLSVVRPEREILFRLVPAAPPAPPVRIIGVPTAPTHKPAAALPAPSSVAPSAMAPPSGIAGFGQSLFGCAPETYNSLPPDAHARCPKPGEGMTARTEPDLMGGPGHVKDEAHWRMEWARVHEPSLLPCNGFANIMCLLGKIANGSLDDYGDPAKWPVYATRQFRLEDLHKIEQAYADWNRQHTVTPETDCAPRTASGASTDRPADGRSPCPASPPGPASKTSLPRPDSP